MKYFFNVFALTLVAFSISNAQNWQQLTVPTNLNINDVYFYDEQRGWAAGDQGVLKTTDGGDNWTLYPTNDDLNGIHFVDEMNGWVCGNDGFLLQTTDGGDSWMNRNSGAFDKLRDVFMVDASTGWIVGRDGILRKTTDGGMTWTHQTNPAVDDLYKVFATDENTAWVVGQDGLILHTMNGGTTWMIQPSGTTETIESVYFIDNQNGWISGNLGIVKKTDNGGINWLTQPTDVTADVNDILFIGSGNGWFVTGTGEIYNSIDSGTSWELNDDFFGALFAVNFVNPNYGFVSGANGFMAKYTVVTGIENELNLPFNLTLHQNYPNPFNATTMIQFELSSASFVTLDIFNVIGQKITTLIASDLQAGPHQIAWNAAGQSSGIYYYKIKAGDNSMTKRMVLLK
jgi:photosystem II stability/assembly factor-like uncharacterized protein